MGLLTYVPLNYLWLVINLFNCWCLSKRVSKKAILVHPLIILLSLLFVLFIIGRSNSKPFGDSDITKPLLKRKSLLRAILLLSKDEFDIRNYINIECLIVSKKLFSSQKSYLKGTIKEKSRIDFATLFFYSGPAWAWTRDLQIMSRFAVHCSRLHGMLIRWK